MNLNEYLPADPNQRKLLAAAAVGVAGFALWEGHKKKVAGATSDSSTAAAGASTVSALSSPTADGSGSPFYGDGASAANDFSAQLSAAQSALNALPGQIASSISAALPAPAPAGAPAPAKPAPAPAKQRPHRNPATVKSAKSAPAKPKKRPAKKATPAQAAAHHTAPVTHPGASSPKPAPVHPRPNATAHAKANADPKRWT